MIDPEESLEDELKRQWEEYWRNSDSNRGLLERFAEFWAERPVAHEFEQLRMRWPKVWNHPVDSERFSHLCRHLENGDVVCNCDKGGLVGLGLLGLGPSRNFKIFRTEFPAIFRFNGKLYQEFYDIDEEQHIWIEVSEETAQRWLAAETRG